MLGWCCGCGYGRGMRIGAVLIDIDGVLTVSWQPLPGAVAALRWLRAAAAAAGPGHQHHLPHPGIDRGSLG